jgi:oligoribonuclease (3'-5' exoribonuclease)
MAPRTDIQLWIDLEATGSLDEDEIVEIGLSMVETATFTEIDFFSRVVEPSTAGWARMEAKQVVLDMHKASGLYDELVTMRELRSSRNRIKAVDEEVRDWIRGIVGSNTTHIPVGGSGIPHYDRKYIRRDMPLLNAYLTHWHLDVGSTERQFRMFGAPWLKNPDGDKMHRALADARFHFREALYVRDVLAAVRWEEISNND